MTILQSLERYYGRMAARGEVEQFGFTRENISYVLVLSVDGSVRDVQDRRVQSGKNLRPARMAVPRPKRTSNVQANFLWDKTAYAFARGTSKRLAKEHAEFKSFHRSLLAGVDEPHARAMLAFIDRWAPEQFDQAPFTEEMLDASFAFALEDERLLFHDVPALQALWVASLEEPDAPRGLCLVSGEDSPLETGHPILKGVQDAQTSGAYLVSYNNDAFTSFGKPRDATNAPTSKAAAFRYGAALNRMLDRGSRNRLQRTVGDATVAFWADTSASINEEDAVAAENAFVLFADPPGEADEDDDPQQAVKLRDALDKVAAGRPVEDLGLGLRRGTRFHILGLAPNAARLSVRYWLDDTFEAFARRLAEHYRDLRIEPLPRGWKRPPSVQRLLVKTTALQERFDNIPPLLAGEVMRAVLSGTRYPRTLLAAAIIRLRAGDDPATGWHAAAIRAVLERDRRLREKDHERDLQEVPVSLAKDDPHPAYQLGRLFAALETAQRLALGRVNATIRDRYFGAASATPASVFPLLLRGVQNHVGKLRKEGKGIWIEREIGEIVDQLPAELPRSLKLDAQGRFAIGYYHQRQAQFASLPTLASTEADEAVETEVDENGDV